MHWLDRLQETTGRHGPRQECDWTAVESGLGTRLPTDWKELGVRFGPGSFSFYVFPLRNGEGADSLLRFWRSLRRKSQEDPEWMAGYFNPFELYDPTEGSGLIMWGRSETGGRFYWLADSSADPATWPLVARPMWGEEWHPPRHVRFGVHLARDRGPRIPAVHGRRSQESAVLSSQPRQD
ncbi:hypothetical protein [Streptomyces carpinensis]|uniref:hypothetical protein n=1 Tax=Streptomyces carpinensis TaxID=66369 RepID=UPI000A3603CF|nr:hypothetical protein [Streptomyces carpinensis]